MFSCLRKNVERLYTDKFSAYKYVEYTDPVNRQTKQKESCILSDIPCRCSYSSDYSAEKNEDGIYTKKQAVKLITSSEYNIPSGTKITVTKSGGRETSYKASGQPLFYSTHQEINLKLLEEYT